MTIGNRNRAPRTRLRPGALARATLAAGCLGAGGVHAMSFDSGDPDLKIRWDNTFKYSNAFRLKQPSDKIMADARTDDGDRNFGKGLISNRVDLLSEFDAGYRNFGARVSAAAWFDSVYNQSNDNGSPATSNNTNVAFNQFTEATRNRMGRRAELQDAFVFAKGTLGDVAGTVRLGRHSLVYGETLFFGANGIANAQGPIDLVKLLAVPGSQFKEVLRPVNQVSGQFDLTRGLSLGAYYQLQWEKSILPPAGSYLSTLDFVGEGAESAVPRGVFTRSADVKPRDGGQGGLQLRYRIPNADTEVGFYAARYHDKTPNIYLTLDPSTSAPSHVVHAYAEGIRTFGMSLSTTLGPFNVAAEVSKRSNVPLVTDPQVVVAGAADNSGRPAYAVGETLHANVSFVHIMETSALWQGGVWLMEVAWNRRASITANASALDPNTTRDATAFRTLFSPLYYQVLPGLDLSFPIGLGYNISGKSSAVFGFNGGVKHGGDLSIGMTGDFRSTWQFGLNYVKYLGGANSFLTPPNSNSAFLSYQQALKDRDFLTFNIRRSF